MANEFDLESLVNLEQTFFDEGYGDGFEHGRIHGLIEGRALGREKGFEMWEELGFYEGFALTWKAILVKQGRNQDRAMYNVKHLLDLISQFPKTNPSSSDASTIDIPQLFRQIRSRYKALCSTLGVKPRMSTGHVSNEDADENNQQGEPSGSVWRLDNYPKRLTPQDLSF